MKTRPLAIVALLYISGILLARYVPGALVPLAAAFVFASFLLKWCGALHLPMIILLAGFVTYSARYAVVREDDLRAMFGEVEEIVRVRGELIEAPVVREFPGRTRTNYSTSAAVRVSEVNRGERWEAARGVVMTSSSGVLGEEFRPGAEVEISGVIRPPPSAVAEGLFDYREYLYHQRIFHQLRADAGEDWRLMSVASFSFRKVTDEFQKWAQGQLARGLPQDQTLELIWAMTLGWKTGLDGTVAEAFMKTGTMHIFAISGLHVACIAGVLVFALRFAGFTRQHCGWIAIPLLWFYTIATGWQPTAVRSALMSTVLILGWGMKRPTDMLNSTAAAGLLILMFEPEQVFQASFQLSFLVVASMGLFLPVLEVLRQKALAHDPFLPPQLRPKWQQRLDKPVRVVTTNFTVSLASWIGSLPLVAWYFNITTPISLLANLLAVPLSSIALTTSLMSLVFFPLGPLFNWISYIFMKATVWVTYGFAEISWGYYHVPKPGALFFLLYYSAVFTAFALPHLDKAKRIWVAALPVALALTWCVSLLPRDPVKVTMLPISGNPVVLDMPGRGRDLLVDCSDEHGSEFVLKRYLRAQGIGTVANVLVTHGDINHAGGYELVWREFTPKSIFTSGARARSPTYRQMIRELEKGYLQWHKVRRGDEIAGWTVLHPGENSFARADDNSVVLRGEIHGWRILLLSELGRAGQRELARSGQDLRADIVITGAPEQDEPMEADLLAHIQPRMILIGNTAGFVNARAESRLMQRLRKTGIPTFSTSRHGALNLEIDSEQCVVRAASGRELIIRK